MASKNEDARAVRWFVAAAVGYTLFSLFTGSLEEETRGRILIVTVAVILTAHWLIPRVRRILTRWRDRRAVADASPSHMLGTHAHGPDVDQARAGDQHPRSRTAIEQFDHIRPQPYR